jgi:hypothetical protein
MFGKYNGFVSKARVSACMYFLVKHVYWGVEGMKRITTFVGGGMKQKNEWNTMSMINETTDF